VRRRPHDILTNVSSVSDGNHFTISEDFVIAGIPYYRGQDVVGNFFVEQSTPRCITEEAFTRPYMARSHLKRGDVLLSIVGTIGDLSLVASDKAATCSCKLAILRPRGIAPEYLAVALRSKYGRLQIERLTRGAVQMGLLLDDMDQLMVPRLSKEVEARVARAVSVAKETRDRAAEALLIAEGELTAALGLDDWVPPSALSYVRSLSELKAAGRWDSQFHAPVVDAYLERLSARLPLETVASLGEVLNGEPVAYSDVGTIPVIRSGDLVDLDDDARFLKAADGESLVTLQTGDILISSIGFGSIGKVQVFDKPGTYGVVSEVTVIRERALDPYFVAAFLRSKAGQVQIERWITGATGQLHLYPRDVKRIMIPIGDVGLQGAMRLAAEKCRLMRRRANELLAVARRAVEVAVEDDEKAALRVLDALGV
jgi:hypothetical protein